MSTDTIFSETFRADDADLSFISSDNVVFQIHSRNLECICGGFAPSGFTQDKEKDLIALSEDAAALEILFQFVYPRAHPELENIEIDLLLKVAEAAQKYQVFSALNICNVRLREHVRLSPIEILKYGFKHDRRDLITKAVPHCQDVPLTVMVKLLPPALFVPWVEYYEQRRSTVLSAFMQALKQVPSGTTAPICSWPVLTPTASQNSSAIGTTSSGSLNFGGGSLFGAPPSTSTSHPASSSITSGPPPTATSTSLNFGGGLFGGPSSTSTSHLASTSSAFGLTTRNSSTRSAPVNLMAGHKPPSAFSGGVLFDTCSGDEKTEGRKIDDGGIILAMQYFYKEDAAVTSTQGLRIALLVAFSEAGAEVPRSCCIRRAKHFIGIVEGALGKVPPFETFLRL